MEPLPRPARIILLYSAGHLGSALVMNRLVDMPEVDVVGVIKAQPLSLTRQGKTALRRHLRRVGWRFAWLLFFQRLVQGLGYLLSMLMPWRKKRLLPAWKIARERRIPVLETDDVNAPATLDFVRRCRADLLISAYFSQILKSEVIQATDGGVLNLHPGWLPSYRGAMAYFWVLHNDSQRGGVSVHWIDEGIDTGQVLERRDFGIPRRATQETVMTLTAIIGVRLLRRVVRRLQAGEDPVRLRPPRDDEAVDYYPMPGSEEFDTYFERRRFFRIRDVLGLITLRGARGPD